MYIISQQKTFEHNHKMKTIKLFAGICAIAAICACGNAKPESQATAIENAIEEVKEQGTVFYDITLDEALAKAKAEGIITAIITAVVTTVNTRVLKRYLPRGTAENALA